jgi:hypothetical protein
MQEFFLTYIALYLRQPKILPKAFIEAMEFCTRFTLIEQQIEHHNCIVCIIALCAAQDKRYKVERSFSSRGFSEHFATL